MERIERTDAPDWLKEKWQEWGEKWAARYAKTKTGKSFKWGGYNNKVYKDLLPVLSAMTKYHCSFCDAYPLGRRLEPTIEHFKPKTKFPGEAYKWENLFLCCRLCQKKGEAFDERLLKPDNEDYSFDKYFDIDWATGELIPNPDASADDRERARITINLYRLNDNGKPEDRLEELTQFDVLKELENLDIDKFSYRFFIKRGQSIDTYRQL
jgi:uncharacterized protein (TIGR02646 family)